MLSITLGKDVVESQTGGKQIDQATSQRRCRQVKHLGFLHVDLDVHPVELSARVPVTMLATCQVGMFEHPSVLESQPLMDGV